MPRSLLLVPVLLAALTASAALPIAPLEPRIGLLPESQRDPAAVSNGTTTLVAWTDAALPARPMTIQARLLPIHDAAVEVGPGEKPQVAWNGNEYLIANSIGMYMFPARAPFPNVAVTIVHADGTIGPRRFVNTSLGATVNAVAWNGREWVLGFVSHGQGRVVLLDRELNVVRTIELGSARRADLTTIDGEVWVVHQRTDDTEVFATGDEGTRFRVAGRAHMVGRIAIVEDLLRVSLLDPRSGFPEPRPILATSDIPLSLVHAAPYGSGAVFAIWSPYGRTLLLVTVDAAGFRQEYTPVLTNHDFTPQVAVAGSTLFVEAHFGGRSQIFGFPLQPWPRTPFALTREAIVSLFDYARQRDPVVASNGSTALAFWNQRTEDVDTEAAFMRAIDANGVPFGPITQLPFTLGRDVDVAYHGDRFVLVWTSPFGEVYASTGGAPVLLGRGTAPAVARAAHGTFVVWRNPDGIVAGTPLRDDATPHVPGGFPILPSLTTLQSAPAIAPVAYGFHVLWSAEDVTSVIVSPAGTPLTSSALAPATPGRIVIGGTLAAWPRMLAAFGGDGTFPVERVAQPWREELAVVAIHPLGGGRHLVTLAEGRTLYTSVVTVIDGRIAGHTPPRLLLQQAVPESSVAVVGEKPLAVYGDGRSVYVATYPVKRRAVR